MIDDRTVLECVKALMKLNELREDSIMNTRTHNGFAARGAPPRVITPVFIHAHENHLETVPDALDLLKSFRDRASTAEPQKETVDLAIEVLSK